METDTTRDPGPPEDELRQMKEFFRKNGSSLLLGASVILLAVLGAALYRSRKSEGVEKASEMLSAARTVNDIEALIKKYPSSPSAPLALLKLARAHFDSGNYDQALNQYDEFKQKFPAHPMAGAAEIARIHCFEARGQIEEALAQFSAFSTTHPDHFMTPLAILGQARCLELLGRYQEAKVVYEDFVAAHSDSEWISKAEDLLTAVHRKLRSASKATNTQTVQSGPPSLPAGQGSPATDGSKQDTQSEP